MAGRNGKLTVEGALAKVLVAPTPEALWQLRGNLFEAGLAADQSLGDVIHEFHAFLSELAAKATARQYSHFASLLDIGAVGGVVVQNLMALRDGDNLLGHLLTGGLSEGLMVLAARQYVKAWEGEMNSVYQEAAWYLFEELWKLSVRHQSHLDNSERRRLLEELLAPLHQETLGGTVKAALIARLFQLLLLGRLRDSLQRPGEVG